MSTRFAVAAVPLVKVWQQDWSSPLTPLVLEAPPLSGPLYHAREVPVMFKRFWPGAIVLSLPLALCLVPAQGQQIHRNSFEGPQPLWVKGPADAEYEQILHAMSDQGAHDGQRSEYLQIKAKRGNYVYYQYPTGR